MAELSQVLESYSTEARRFGSEYWRQIFKDGRFALTVETAFPFAYPMPVTGLIDRALSTSYIAMLPPDEQAKLRGRIGDLIARHDELKTATEIAFPYVSLLYVLRKV